MIDLHSHLLPAIDDGSRSTEQSLRVLNRLGMRGVTDLVLTPHVRSSELDVDADDPLERRGAAFEMLRSSYETGPTLHLGFEIMLDQPLPSWVVRDRRFSLAGSRYYLVEFPVTVVGAFATRVLAEMVEQGFVPLVAHPERYQSCPADTVAAWHEAGARMQVDATTLTRATGRGHRARELLKRGLADVMAADNHGGARCVATGVDFLRERHAGRQADLLALTNPRAVLDDCPLEPVPAATALKETWVERLKRRTRG